MFEVGDPAEEMERLRVELAAASARMAHLEQALQSNPRIALAAGILMSRYHISAEQAFDRLRQVSQRRNTKMRDLAEDVIYCGDLPAVPGAGGSSATG